MELRRPNAIPKLILAHDYLIQMGGAERVVASMVRHHPKAEVYTSAADPEGMWPEFQKATIHTSWLQTLPGMPAKFKMYFPFYASAFTSFGVVPCDVAWISSSTFAKCLKLPRYAFSVCYCHNPTRFLWRTEEYVDGEVNSHLLKNIARLSFPMLRQVDRKAAWRMNVMVANSHNVRKRILECYGRESRVVPPPVEVDRFTVSNRRDGYYLIVSRLLGYKRIDRAVEAFNLLKKKLVIIGDGPDRARLESISGPTIKFLGRLSDADVVDNMERCNGFIFPGEEDFGITPVEAQACGKPVIAWARGGALETVKNGVSGVLFNEGSGQALAAAVLEAENTDWDPHEIRHWSEQFSEQSFHQQMDDILAEASEQQVIRLASLAV